jgi:hypothetical protein
MNDTQQLDQAFHFIMETFVKRGDAPHYTEIAKQFGVHPEEGKRILHDLINTHGRKQAGWF